MVKWMEERSSHSVQSDSELPYLTCWVNFLSLWTTQAPALQSCPVLWSKRSGFSYGDWKSHLALSSDPYCKCTWGWQRHAWSHHTQVCTSASYLIRQWAIAGFIKGCWQLCLRDMGSVAPRVPISDRDKPLLLLQDFYVFWVHGPVHNMDLTVSWFLCRVIPYSEPWFSSLLVQRCLTPCSHKVYREFRDITQGNGF